MADYNRRMARRIQSEREKLGLSHTELAAKVGSTDRTVRRWEAAKSEPQPRHLRALAETFELDVTDLRPNLEAEERLLKDQLDRIEAKLDRLLAGLAATEQTAAAGERDLDQAADELERDAQQSPQHEGTTSREATRGG